MEPLENLKLLRTDMQKFGWIIEAFCFKYKSIEYIVLVRLLDKDEKRDKYALLKLEFISKNNPESALECEANSRKLIIDTKVLRKYFGIEYSENIGLIVEQFTIYLGNFIPKSINKNKTEIENMAIVNSLNKRTNEGNYCFSIKRNRIVNGKQRTRSPNNDNKTRILRPRLYEKFGKDQTLSFCYSDEEHKEKDDIEIISNFVNNPNFN